VKCQPGTLQLSGGKYLAQIHVGVIPGHTSGREMQELSKLMYELLYELMYELMCELLYEMMHELMYETVS
jgi:hypothetical protein